MNAIVLTLAASTLGTGSVPAVAPTGASVPQPPEEVKSMGQPPRIKPYVAGAFSWNRGSDDGSGGQAAVGLYKDLVVPVSGGLGLSLEGYGGGAAGEWDGGARFFITTRLLFLGFGWDWNFRTGERDGVMTLTPPLRRGGLFGRGGSLRIDWIRTRGNSFNVGYQIPLVQRMRTTRSPSARWRSSASASRRSGRPSTSRVRFARDLDQIGELTSQQRADALGTMDRLEDLLELGRQRTRRHWGGDERRVWMPPGIVKLIEQEQLEKLISVKESGARRFGRWIRKVL